MIEKISKKILFISFIFIMLFLPLKANAAQDVFITVDGKSYNINNFLDNETNRTYVSISDFCAKTSLCEIVSPNIVQKRIYKDINDLGKVNDVYYLVEFSKDNNTVKNRVVFNNWGNTSNDLKVSNDPGSDTKAFKQVFETYNGSATTVTYVPLRFFAESMWYNVSWNGNSKTASITTYDPVVKYNHMKGNQITSNNGCPPPSKYVVSGSELKDNTWENLSKEFGYWSISRKVVTFQICKTNSGDKFYIGEAYIQS